MKLQTKSADSHIPHSTDWEMVWTSRDARTAGTLVGAGLGVEVTHMIPGEVDELLANARNKQSRGGTEGSNTLVGEL